MAADYVEVLRVALEASRNGDDDPGDSFYLDWSTFWAHEYVGPTWLVEPILPAGRSVAMYAKGGAGKSLLALWLAAGLATGRPLFGVTAEPVSVLYLDYEMTEDDLLERLEDMGYGPEVDMSNLHYALLPSIGPFDTEAGGNAIVARAAAVEAALVFVDTFGRAVAGKENDADTLRAWYRWTGQRLKAAGRAFVRVDHAGKDIERGQRGTSAKNDDVDVVWHLEPLEDHRFRLKATKRRMSWVPELIELDLMTEPETSYRLSRGMVGYPAGTAACAELLERLGVPADWGRRKIRRALQEAREQVANEVLTGAIRYRKNRMLNVPRTCGQPVDKCAPNVSAEGADTPPADTPPGHVKKPLVDTHTDTSGHAPQSGGAGECVPIKGHTGTRTGPGPSDDDDGKRI